MKDWVGAQAGMPRGCHSRSPVVAATCDQAHYVVSTRALYLASVEAHAIDLCLRELQEIGVLTVKSALDRAWKVSGNDAEI
ncbi:hypothetical protein V2J09_000803 [Rumex salicifolius]